MKLRIAAISFCLCVCLLAAPSSRATDPSPFALPPETDPTPAAPQATPATPAAPQPEQPAPATGQTPSPSPSEPQQPARTTATDPDTAFDLPTSGPSATTAVPASGLPPSAQQGAIIGSAQPPSPAAELLAQGTELARQGKYEEARIALESALAKEPGNVLCLNNLGLVMRKLGKIEEATRAYTSAIQTDPAFALTYKNYGILLEQNGEKRRAVDAYRKYCSLAPSAADIQKVSQRADWLAGGL